MFDCFSFTLEVHVHTYNEVGFQYVQRNYATDDGKENMDILLLFFL